MKPLFNVIRGGLAVALVLLTACKKDEAPDTAAPTVTIESFSVGGVSTAPSGAAIAISKAEVPLQMTCRLADDKALKSYTITMATIGTPQPADVNWNFTLAADTLTGVSRRFTGFSLRASNSGMAVGAQFRLTVQCADATGNFSNLTTQTFAVTN